MAKLHNCNVLKKQTLGSVLVLILLAQELQACSKKIALMCLQHLRFFPTIVQRFLSAGLFTHYHLQTCISSSSCAAMDMNLICNLDVSLPGQVIEDEDDDIYIMVKCLSVCVSRKMITSSWESPVTT